MIYNTLSRKTNLLYIYMPIRFYSDLLFRSTKIYEGLITDAISTNVEAALTVFENGDQHIPDKLNSKQVAYIVVFLCPIEYDDFSSYYNKHIYKNAIVNVLPIPSAFDMTFYTQKETILNIRLKQKLYLDYVIDHKDPLSLPLDWLHISYYTFKNRDNKWLTGKQILTVQKIIAEIRETHLSKINKDYNDSRDLYYSYTRLFYNFDHQLNFIITLLNSSFQKHSKLPKLEMDNIKQITFITFMFSGKTTRAALTFEEYKIYYNVMLKIKFIIS